MVALLLAQAPALPLDEAGKYVAAAYVVFVVLLVVYVAIMAAKLARIGREIEQLASLAETQREEAARAAADRDQGVGGDERVEARAGGAPPS